MSECEARGTDYGLSGLRHHPTYGPAATAQEERVARAICQSAVESAPSMMTPAGKAMLVDSHWPNHIAGARAAIAAYPEPPKPPPVPPVEGDEVFLTIGAERCKGHLLGIRNSGRRAGGQIAWVSIYDLSRDDMDYVTVDYLSLVRA